MDDLSVPLNPHTTTDIGLNDADFFARTEVGNIFLWYINLDFETIDLNNQGDRIPDLYIFTTIYEKIVKDARDCRSGCLGGQGPRPPVPESGAAA